MRENWYIKNSVTSKKWEILLHLYPGSPFPLVYVLLSPYVAWAGNPPFYFGPRSLLGETDVDLHRTRILFRHKWKYEVGHDDVGETKTIEM